MKPSEELRHCFEGKRTEDAPLICLQVFVTCALMVPQVRAPVFWPLTWAHAGLSVEDDIGLECKGCYMPGYNSNGVPHARSRFGIFRPHSGGAGV